jgi:hypothetical protein
MWHHGTIVQFVNKENPRTYATTEGSDGYICQPGCAGDGNSPAGFFGRGEPLGRPQAETGSRAPMVVSLERVVNVPGKAGVEITEDGGRLRQPPAPGRKHRM